MVDEGKGVKEGRKAGSAFTKRVRAPDDCNEVSAHLQLTRR